MTTTPKRIELCKTGDVAPSETLLVEIDDEDLMLTVYNVEGEFFVTNDECTHGPGSLSEGVLDGYIIECDFHNGAFDIRTGEVVAPPCMTPLKTYSVVVENDVVLIEQ